MGVYKKTKRDLPELWWPVDTCWEPYTVTTTTVLDGSEVTITCTKEAAMAYAIRKIKQQPWY